MSNKKKRRYLFLLSFIILLILCNVNIKLLNDIPYEFYSNFEEIDTLNKKRKFGQFITVNYDKNNLLTETNNKPSKIVFKLFGFIPIKKSVIKKLPEESVFAGGQIIGLSANLDGVIVVSNSLMNIDNKKVEKNSFFKENDIIIELDNKKIYSVQQVQDIMSNINNSNIVAKIIRNGNTMELNVPLLKSNLNNKLGLWVKDDISGIGTLTFVNPENGKYAALGHSLTDDKGNLLRIKNGEIYKSSLVGINKSQTNKPGEIKGYFLKKNKIGSIDKNTKYGITGEMLKDDIENNRQYKLGGRFSVHPGKAKILSSISGIEEEYEIKIIKASYQKSAKTKSIVFNVTDKKLISLSGGIVQGMSGSPIIQDGKIVGAVTHVFISNPKKGYGVYTDWMIEQI